MDDAGTVNGLAEKGGKIQAFLLMGGDPVEVRLDNDAVRGQADLGGWLGDQSHPPTLENGGSEHPFPRS